MNNQYNAETGVKRDWMRPELRVIEAGSAESNESGPNVDISNPQRS